MDLQALDVSVEDGLARITFAQPDRGNPIDRTWTRELQVVGERLAEDASVRAVLVTAQGKYFCVGGNLEELGAETVAFITEAAPQFHAGVAALSRGNAPVVVAVQGMCAGGGVSFAAGADFVFAGESTRFYAAYQGIGLAIDGGGSYFVPRRVGLARATGFYLRNQMWSAADALAYGLVDEVVSDAALVGAAEALARELAAGPTVAFGQVKRLLARTFDQTLEQQLDDETRAMIVAGGSADAAHAIGAVAKREQPTFKGA